jgi:hypothetical protein
VIVADHKGKVLYNRMGRITPADLVKGIRKYAAVEGDRPGNEVNPAITYLKDIAATLYYKNDLAFFFLKNGQYAEYNLITGRITGGKSQPINNKTWKGLAPYARNIVAALNWGQNKAHLFLSDGKYLRVDLRSRIVDKGYPREINERTWPGLTEYKDKIIGAVKWNENKIFFFLSSRQYLRYDIKAKRIEKGYPKPVNDKTWRGMQKYAGQLRAVTNGGKGIAYFFLTNGSVVRYDIRKNIIIGGR